MANMSKSPRLYRVVHNGTTRLVSGHNQAQIARYLVISAYHIEPVSAMEAAELVSGGVKVESACGKTE